MGEHALIAHETDPMVALLLLIIIAIVVGYLGMHFLFRVIGG